MNRKLSAAWAGVVLAMTVGHLTYRHFAASGAATQQLNLLLNWVVPIGLALGAFRYTERVTGGDVPATR